MSEVQFIKVSREDKEIRLDRWFKKHFPQVSHSSIEKALRKGQIKVNGERIKSSYKISQGEIIRVPPMNINPDANLNTRNQVVLTKKQVKDIRSSIIFQDNDILVLNKPRGLATQGGNKVRVSVDNFAEHLKYDCKSIPKIVHRLDKDTSGVLLMGRNDSSTRYLAEIFREKQIQKTYLAFVVGSPKHDKGKIDLPISKQTTGDIEKMIVGGAKAKEALTHYKVIDKIKDKIALLELKPITGRTHQLRVHMSEIGFPILGDGKYGGKDAFVEGLSRFMHLHAHSVAFKDIEQKRKTFIAPLPDHFMETCNITGIEF